MSNPLTKIIQREQKNYPGRTLPAIFFLGFLRKIKNKYVNTRMAMTKDSTFLTEDSLWMCSLFPKKILDVIIQERHPLSVLDVGSGTGVSLKYMLDKGIEATGLENSAKAIKKSIVKDHIIRHNLNKEINLNKKFDLTWCFEVIEHIHPDFENTFLNTLVNHSDYIILSAARPGQGGHGHFNEKEPSYWIDKFAQLGYIYDLEFTRRLTKTGEMHAENILCFYKS